LQLTPDFKYPDRGSDSKIKGEGYKGEDNRKFLYVALKPIDYGTVLGATSRIDTNARN